MSNIIKFPTRRRRTTKASLRPALIRKALGWAVLRAPNFEKQATNHGRTVFHQQATGSLNGLEMNFTMDQCLCQLDIHHKGKRVFTVGLNPNGEIHTSFQRRGEWEKLLLDIDVEEVEPSAWMAEFYGWEEARG